MLGGARIGCGVAVFVVLNVFFFVEEAFVGAFRLVMTTATVRSNWWVVGVERNFGRFYTLFVMNFRENDFWSQPSKNRCSATGVSMVESWTCVRVDAGNEEIFTACDE